MLEGRLPPVQKAETGRLGVPESARGRGAGCNVERWVWRAEVQGWPGAMGQG